MVDLFVMVCLELIEIRFDVIEIVQKVSIVVMLEGNCDVCEMLEIFQVVCGGFKVLGWLVMVVKWVGWIVGGVVVVYVVWYSWSLRL